MQPYFDLTDDQIAFFEPLFGPYPLDQYGLAFTDSFAGLAMETQGRSLFSPDDFTTATPGARRSTCCSPTSWPTVVRRRGDARPTGATCGSTSRSPRTRQWMWLDHAGLWDLDAQAEDNLRRRQQPTEPTGEPTRGNLFGYERYDGGAVVLHALRGELGDDTFFELLQRWVADNDGTSRTTDDFIALADEVAGRPLDDFFDAWLFADAVPPEYP